MRAQEVLPGRRRAGETMTPPAPCPSPNPLRLLRGDSRKFSGLCSAPLAAQVPGEPAPSAGRERCAQQPRAGIPGAGLVRGEGRRHSLASGVTVSKHAGRRTQEASPHLPVLWRQPQRQSPAMPPEPGDVPVGCVSVGTQGGQGGAGWVSPAPPTHAHLHLPPTPS